MSAAEDRIAAAGRVLIIGIGGGGDVVGALAAAGLAEALGTPAEVGGITWERLPIDPLPGPRRIAEITGAAEHLHAAAVLAGPATTGPGGFRFAESGVAGLLGRPTALIDINDGPAAVAEGLAAAAARLEADLVVLLDVGGDALAHGGEAGLASPLADATVLACAPALARAGVQAIGAVFGAGCDGELEPAEVLERIAEVAGAGGDLGASVPPPAALALLESALPHVPTEASAMALRCARGERGPALIRAGRRSVELTEAGGVIHWFDPGAAIDSAARLARAVQEATSLRQAHEILMARGVRTELAYELEAAGEA